MVFLEHSFKRCASRYNHSLAIVPYYQNMRLIEKACLVDFNFLSKHFYS